MPLLDALPLAASESNLLAARELMAFTLAFHIVLACIGVALPAIILTANWLGLRRGDEDAMRLARRWSKAMAVTFAVGAVTGTVLSFEFGLLWPRFMERFGDAFGIAFAIEGIFFFVEAIFLAIYIYGWKRLGGWAHFWSGVPMVITGIGGAFSVVTANAWMNQPQGFTLDAAGRVVGTDPLEVLFNPATGYEVPHMILAAYMVAGFLVASIYAVGMLRGRRDRLHRLGVADPADDRLHRHADPALRRRHRGARNRRPPAGQVRGDGVHRGDRPRPDRVHRRHLHRRRRQGRDPDPRPRLLPGRLQHRHGGHRARPDPRRRGAARQHPAAPLLRRDGRDRHGADGPRRSGSASSGGAAATSRRTPWFLRAVAVSGVASIVALWCGWIVTEVGRQPWIVQGYMRTSEAVTEAEGIWFAFAGIVLLYFALGTVAILVLRMLSRRWREEDEETDDSETPYGPPAEIAP